MLSQGKYMYVHIARMTTTDDGFKLTQVPQMGDIDRRIPSHASKRRSSQLLDVLCFLYFDSHTCRLCFLKPSFFLGGVLSRHQSMVPLRQCNHRPQSFFTQCTRLRSLTEITTCGPRTRNGVHIMITTTTTTSSVIHQKHGLLSVPRL